MTGRLALEARRAVLTGILVLAALGGCSSSNRTEPGIVTSGVDTTGAPTAQPTATATSVAQPSATSAPSGSPTSVAPGAPLQWPSSAATIPGFLASAPRLSLLGDRLTLQPPVGTKLKARGHSVMAAPTPVEEETRLVLDAGAERLVIMSYELFLRSGSDFGRAAQAQVVQDFGPQAPALEPLVPVDPALRVVLAVPSSFDRSAEAIPVLVAYVAHPDGFVQQLAFYVNPAAAQDAAGCGGPGKSAGAATGGAAPLSRCVALAKAVASSLRVGGRKLELAAGARRLQGQYDDDAFVVAAPAGSSTSVTRGPDFTVHRVRLPAQLGEAQPSLGVYVGGHPSYQYRQSGQAAGTSTLSGKLFGRTEQWQVWTVQPGALMAELIVDHPWSSAQGTKVHVFASGRDEAALREVLAVAATLRKP